MIKKMKYYEVSFDNYHSPDCICINAENGELARDIILRNAEHSQRFEKGIMKPYIDRVVEEIKSGKPLIEVFNPKHFFEYKNDTAPVIFFNREGKRK